MGADVADDHAARLDPQLGDGRQHRPLRGRQHRARRREHGAWRQRFGQLPEHVARNRQAAIGGRLSGAGPPGAPLRP